jgi:Uma2 family endonuclease
MSVDTAAPRRASAADLANLPDEVHAEVIGGEIVEKAAPTPEHSDAQFGLGTFLRVRFHRGLGGRFPGGWWILGEVELEFETHEVYRPDLAGWRRERVSERPRERPIRIRPDWVCEILSPSTARRDLGEKMRTLHRSSVPHYWIVDPEHETLTVYRWTGEGYLAALTAGRGERVRAEPFQAVELPVGILFGEEPEPPE